MYEVLREVKATPAAAAEHIRSGGEGQVPITLRIGVTGHRELADPSALIPAIHQAIHGITERLLGSGARPQLLVISALAEGADRLVAREVLTEPGAELEAVLPRPPGDYLDDFGTEESRAEFIELLSGASAVWQVPVSKTQGSGYEQAGRYVVDSSDAVIALWDGEPPRGQGGTATVVAYAQRQRVPLVWVPTTGRSAPVYRLDDQRFRSINEAARELREYNAVTIPQFPLRASKARGLLEPAASQPESLRRVRERVADWVVPYFVRANFLASRLERWFKVMSAAIFGMAAAAVVIVAAQATFKLNPLWIMIEVILLLILLGAPLFSRHQRVLDRWISYRFLAERLRSSYFLALAGPGSSSDRPRRPAYVSDPSEAWIRRALTEIIDRRPHVRMGPSDLAALRHYLSEVWIGGQIRYHRKAARRQGAWENRLLLATVLLFGATLVVAFLHMQRTGYKESLDRWLIVLSICLPAIGAAVHGIRVQAQFRRQCQRYTRMVGLLDQLKLDMDHAPSLARIREVATETERVMREENSDWFGVMRFHDVELIALRAVAARPGSAG
jgi:hypothetical protein